MAETAESILGIKKPKLSKKAKYIFHCRGRYFTQKDEKTKERKTATFELPIAISDLTIFDQTAETYKGIRFDDKSNSMIPQFETTSFKNFLGIMKKKLLPRVMPSHFKDFYKIHTLYIDNVEMLEGSETFKLPIKLMNRGQLKTYLLEKQIPLNADDYLDIADLKSDIELYIEAPRRFEKTIESRKQRRKVEQDFMELNGLE